MGISLSFFLSSEVVTFPPEGVIVGFRNFVWGFKSQKNKIWGKQKIGGPTLPPGGSIFLFVFLGKNEKCLESPEMARN